MPNKKTSNFIYQILFGIVLFLVPTNLFLKFLESSAYVNGLQIDYLIPKLYLIDLVIIFSFIFWLFENKKTLIKKIKHFKNNLFNFINDNKVGSFLIASLIIRQINSYHPIASWWYLSKLFEISLFGLLIYHKRKLLSPVWAMMSLLPTIFFQSIVGLFQFFNQTPVFGYLFLGEANLTKQTGLAKQVINGVERILPYGTTAHPNILGGFLSISLLILIGVLLIPKLNHKKYHQQPFVYGPLGIAIITLGLTFSFSAWLTLLIGIGLLFFKLNDKRAFILSLLIIILSPFFIYSLSRVNNDPSIIRRNYLNHTAVNIFSDHLLWGVGLNNFTTQVEAYSPTREVVRFTQPSHNSFLLILSETGLIGLGLISFIIKKGWKTFKKNQQSTKYLLLLLPILTLDHYLITNSSMLLMGLLFIVITRNFLFRPQK
ncbi:MAG: O-antigen ligase family protein [Candidatus Pacebacteria bacterium]|nr:O-antigen ligase family protein [Candidatus Paceibacterota bacterium]